MKALTKLLDKEVNFPYFTQVKVINCRQAQRRREQSYNNERNLTVTHAQYAKSARSEWDFPGLKAKSQMGCDNNDGVEFNRYNLDPMPGPCN